MSQNDPQGAGSWGEPSTITSAGASAVNTGDELRVQFLSEHDQTAVQVAQAMADFIAPAQQSLDIAIYDFRLTPPAADIITAALRDRAQAGVAIRIAYDAGKEAAYGLIVGADPAPPGTHVFVRGLGYPSRAITGLKLMHDKYIVRDNGLLIASVRTGSANFTDDQWTLCDNNLLDLASPALAAAYTRDFEQLWNTGTLGNSGDFDAPDATLTYAGQPAQVHIEFAPGCGPEIDSRVARLVASAQRRVRICAMIITSGALIGTLSDLLNEGRIPIDGVYDKTQMEGVFPQWQQVPSNHWKIPAMQRIIQEAQLVGKVSTPYTPTSIHDFMHNKVLIVDDTIITGSYNFSRSAEMNAENILFIESAALADTYGVYIDHLKAKYTANPTGNP